MGIEVQGRRRGRHAGRWLQCGDYVREKGLSGEGGYDRATWTRISSYIDPT